jgi:hypothetical protein
MAARLTVPVFYAQGIRNMDKLVRQLSADARVSDANKLRAREAASVLIGIMANAQVQSLPKGHVGNC